MYYYPGVPLGGVSFKSLSENRTEKLENWTGSYSLSSRIK